RDVHVVHIGAAHAIARNVGFSRSQRKPSHTHTNREVSAAHERHQRRSPHRTNHNRSRNPEPATSYERPASVVKWSKAPRLIFHPRPSPWSNIDPVAEA